MLHIWPLYSPDCGSCCLALVTQDCVIPTEIKETISGTIVPTSIPDFEGRDWFRQGIAHIKSLLKFISP